LPLKAAGVISCCGVLTPGPAQTNLASASAEFPVKVHHGDLLIQTRVNGSQPLSFKLDTGFGITTINPDKVESLNLKRVGQMTIEGIAGEEKADTDSGATFEFGAMTYQPRRIAALPSESRRRWRNRDGIIGAGFFRRFVVELDVAHGRMRLLEPASFSYTGSGEVLPLEFERDTPIVEAVIVPHEGEEVRGRFEIDTGCDDFLCVGNEFVAAHGLIQGTSPNEFRRGIGGSAPIRQTVLAELRLGKLIVKKPSANCFLEGSPASKAQDGHIGLAALQRFRMIFDYSRRQLILEPQGSNSQEKR
jgi:predicted aspartyl protease